jgi:tetratricopeptide (TPR) repeat protein
MDKRAIFLSAANQFKRLVLASLFLLLAACAATGQGGGAEADAGDADAMFHIATAERLAGVGEYESALEEYLAAAEVSGDPEVARMVTRLAGRLQAWETAVSAAERWLELEPAAENAHHVRVVALVNQRLPERALVALQDWLSQDAEPTQARFWRRAAMLLSAANEPDTAGEVLAGLTARHGDQAPVGEIDHAGSIMLWSLNQREAARDKALTAARASQAPEHLEWAAQLAVEEGDLEQALSLYRQARERDPDRPSLALAEAEVLRQLDRDEEAIELLAALPEDSETLYTLGIYLVRVERSERAEAVWQQLAELPEERQAPDHAYLVAQLAELVERDEDALAWYARIEDGEQARRSLLRRAIIHGRGGEVDEARDLLVRFREDASNDELHDAWLIEADILRSAGQPEASVELLAAPLSDNPGSVDLLYARALSAALAENIDLAEQDLRRIIQMDGDNAMALNALGYTLTDQTDRHQEAYRLIRRALELDPDDPATLDSMGWVLYRLGRAEEAVDYLERALEGDDNPEIMAHLIEVLDHIGRSEEAADLAERALADHADDPYLQATLERLEYEQ